MAPAAGPRPEAAPAGPATAPEVTVVVPARDEVATIGACLDSVLSQEGVDLEVVVVDNGSTDGTTELLHARAAADPRVVVVSNPVASIPASLNAAVAAARGTWMVRVDAHSTIPQGYVAHAVARLSEGGWAGVGGRKAAVGRSPVGRAIAAVLNSKLAVGGSVYHWGTEETVVDHVPFGAYPLALVRELEGWDERIANNEDFEFDQRARAHGELLFDPRLEIAWNVRETIGDLWRQYRRYGRGKPAVALRHPEGVSPRHLAPPALVVWLALAAGVAVRRPGLAAAAVAPYALAVGAASVAIARTAPGDADRRAVPAALVAMQVGWGLGFWEGVRDLVGDAVRDRLR
ncbi:glycosyltransferase [Geodermatophilus sp. FMUSA9-8]|uniref:glycosyltransferase n=1 Tax=Geodermatophilus sp. FMUSA9-8 TaxID=3120155 RepID=UPI00300B161D